MLSIYCGRQFSVMFFILNVSAGREGGVYFFLLKKINYFKSAFWKKVDRLLLDFHYFIFVIFLLHFLCSKIALHRVLWKTFFRFIFTILNNVALTTNYIHICSRILSPTPPLKFVMLAPMHFNINIIWTIILFFLLNFFLKSEFLYHKTQNLLGVLHN